MIVRLPYDVSRCNGARCDVRESCARHMAESPRVVPISDFSSLGLAVSCAELCTNFISIRKEFPHECA